MRSPRRSYTDCIKSSRAWPPNGSATVSAALVVEASAVLTIAVYLAALYASHRWTQTGTSLGVLYAVVTGVCVGTGTVVFFLLFQRGGPLSAVPAILAGGAAIMATAGIVWFGEPARPLRLLGIVLALFGLYLVR